MRVGDFVTTTSLRLAAALAAAGLLFAGAARADDAPTHSPNDPETQLRITLTVGPPSNDVKAVREWSEARAAEGRARIGTTLGGDLLSGAAAALAQFGSEQRGALALFLEATGAYPRDASGAGLAWYEVAAIRQGLGDAPGALEALDEGDRLAKRPDVPDDSPWSQSRRDALRRRAATLSPLVRARAWTALQRFSDAAGLYEGMAEETLAERPARPFAAAALFEQAARTAYLEGNLPRTMKDIDRAIELSATDAEVVTRTQWRLLAKHGMLDGKSEISILMPWPGDGFVNAARDVMRSIFGRRGAYRIAMQVASYAVMAQRHKAASDLFDLAFADPAFEADARTDEGLVKMLMTAASEMLAAGRPEDALKRFEQAERLHGSPMTGMETMRIEIDEAIAGVRSRTGDPKAEPDTAREEAASSRQGTGARGSRPGLAGPAPHPETDAAPDREEAPSSTLPWWLYAVAGVVAGAVVLAVAVGVVARRARRRSK